MKDGKQTVKAAFEPLVIPTYKPGKCEELPMFFEKKPYQGASGKLYPIPFTTEISDDKQDKTYTAGILENEYIRVEVLPEIGGKIQRAYDKTTGYDFIYYNKVIKPALIGLAGPWVSGGIEFNWPQHHRPTTFMPVEAEIREYDGGEKTVWVGETEPLYRTKGMAGVTVEPGRSYVKAKVQLYNRTPFAQPFMWWANLAVEINDSYNVTFPQDIEYVHQHDRRDRTTWPIAKGKYCGFDYGDGADLSKIPTVQVSASFMVAKGQSDYDFVSGYDMGRDCGIVTVSNHHVAPGKKLFHWGCHSFGRRWCANLTDDGSRYVELMTGGFTDNQPDFSYIMPYETKRFEQYWYPISKIGLVKNATIDGAVNIEKRAEGLFLGFCTTGEFKNCLIEVKNGEEVIFADRADIAPGDPYVKQTSIAVADGDMKNISVLLKSEAGKVLVKYKTVVRGSKIPRPVRQPALDPKDIATTEELYLNGLHLEQYRAAAYKPEPYYLEALRRDRGDIRCNTAMGSLLLSRGSYLDAISYFDKAIERLTSRNDNPIDTEAFYKRGLAYLYLGRDKEAYDDLYRSVWSYAYASAGYYLLAALDCKAGDYESALEKLEQSLAGNSMNLYALKLKAVLTGDKSIGDRIREIDPLFECSTCKPDYAIDSAIEFMRAGLTDKALEELAKAEQSDSMVRAYTAYLKQDRSLLDSKERVNLCFPSRLEDIPVLEWIGTPMARYRLGCLLYDKFRYDDAIAQWEIAAREMPDYAPTFRNLAQAYFEKKGDKISARIVMENAHRVDAKSSRIFYELVQLYKNSELSPEQRLRLHESDAELSESRDDCTVDRALLLAVTGRQKEALELMGRHRFHIYEGGEGNLTRLHAWIHMLQGDDLMAAGKYSEALEAYESGIAIPENYGEYKSYYTQEQHLYYGMYRAAEALGDSAKAQEYLDKASRDVGGVTEITLWQVKALREMGRFSEAKGLLDELVLTGEAFIAEKDVPDFFGVGAATPMPFELDRTKVKEAKGACLAAFGYAGLGRTEEARKLLSRFKELDSTNISAYVLEAELTNGSK